MLNDHQDAVEAAYRLRHRLRTLGAVIDAYREHGPLVTPRHAAWLLAVDESRVRALIREKRLRTVLLPGPGGGVRLVPVGDLLQAPTPCERGRPLVVKPDGSVGRDAGGHDGLCIPVLVGPEYGRPPPKKSKFRPGRQAKR